MRSYTITETDCGWMLQQDDNVPLAVIFDDRETRIEWGNGVVEYHHPDDVMAQALAHLGLI